MISNSLANTRIEVLTGSAVVAAGEMSMETKLNVLLKTAVALVSRKGAYRFDVEPPQVKVLVGRTMVQGAATHGISVAAGQLLPLDGQAHSRKFDARQPDPLEEWSDDRVAYLAQLQGKQTKNAQKTTLSPPPPGITYTKDRPPVFSQSIPDHSPSACAVAVR
jgi:hypothetical protein